MGTRKYLRSSGDRGLNLRFVDIDLAVARDNVRFEIGGTFMFAPFAAFDNETTKSTTLSVGHCFIRFGKSSAPAVYFTGNYQYPDEQGFDEIFVTNSAQSNAMLRLYYSDGPQIRPFSAETAVTVLNPGAIGVPAGIAHAGATSRVAGGVGNYSLAQIFNPLASGVLVYVDEIVVVDPSSTIGPTAAFYDVALGTLGTSFGPIDRRNPAGQAELRSDAVASATYAANATTIKWYQRINDLVIDQPPVPYVLDEGEGIVVRPGNTNVAAQANFQWREI